jgi:2-polyprenyl-3-methyl-5-hydroxy-6-metoxy-1,4-benzoquinol methylase
MKMESHGICIVCGGELKAAIADWHRCCPDCGYESAQLAAAINAQESHARVDEDERAAGLMHLRQGNFEIILSLLAKQDLKPAARLLEVGCAHGWFLEMAKDRFEAVGVEPDERMCRTAQAKGLPVRPGFFPEALSHDERFDVIVFNDVIEHIPDIGQTLASCCRLLNAGGLLCLNLPNSRGFFYRLAKAIARVGLTGPFERMWQVGLPSPHVHYFNETNLRGIVEQAGFSEVEVKSLASISSDGLLDRIRYVGKPTRIKVWLVYLGVLAAAPIIRMFPSDITVSIFRKSPI